MAAKIVIIRDEKEWEIVGRVLDALGDGGIIIPPEKCEHLDENMPDWEDHLGTELECYDFDGGSDKRADIAYGGSDAYNAIDDFLIAAQEKQRENSNE